MRDSKIGRRSLLSGVAMAGIATALAIEPDLPRNWRQGRLDAPALKPITWKNKPLAATAHMAAVKYQLSRLSHRRRTSPGVSPAWALVVSQLDAKRRAKQYRRWMEAEAAA